MKVLSFNIIEGNTENYYNYIKPNLYHILPQDIEFIQKGRKGKKEEIANIPCCFDIETSSFYEGENKRCCMYAWVFGINGLCIMGRTWKEFKDTIYKLEKVLQLSPQKRLIIYVHNLSYEFQFFKELFEWEKVFSLEPRKPVYAITKSGIEFRCSYILSGYSLEKLGENLTKYKVKKMVGDLDYSLIRHSETPLNDKEIGYIVNDCLVVMAHIQEEIERLGDITKIPITKTGYVRELCKENCIKGANRFEYSRLMKALKLDKDSYISTKQAYTGGFTHANINYVGKVIKNVHSYDFSSSYPAVMLSEKYPMSTPKKYEPKDEDDFIFALKCFCCMFTVEFTDLVSTCRFENYISVSRCHKIEHYVPNNGRVVEADRLIITITEQDFFIISKLYKWKEMKITNMRVFYKDYLPRDFILSILELYKAKTELKGVKGKEVEYMVSKNMINSCYGMCVTDICKNDIVYENGEWKTIEANINELIEKYNNNRQRVLFYPWGVWVTAYARANLFSGILEFKNDYIYSDTDSIKVINVEKHKDYIENYNNKIKEKIENCLNARCIPLRYATPKTKNGVEKPLGVWDYEGMYSRFKTLGAKRYITESDNELSITIAGVGKKAGIKYLKWKYGNNDNIFNHFEEDLTFPSNYPVDGKDECGSGKMLHTYIDHEMEGYVIDYLGKKGYYKELSGMHLENTEYTLSLEKEYLKLLQGIKGSEII